MGAISIALDVTIAGALALPWVWLVIRLFCPEVAKQLSLTKVRTWSGQWGNSAIAAVLLFAAAYFVGSVVTRTGQDFFNDDDLHLGGVSDEDARESGISEQITKFQNRIGRHLLLRIGVTEDRIRTRVYCEYFKNPQPGEADDADPLRIPGPDSSKMCGNALSWIVIENPQIRSEDEKLQDYAVKLFGMQEAAVLINGEDKTLRLRQLHDQIMVLRSTAFNGFIAFSLCSFAWCAGTWCRKSHSRTRWALCLIPGAYLTVAAIAFAHHWRDRGPDPPYMEFSLAVLGIAGTYLLWRSAHPATNPKAEQAETKEQIAPHPTENPKENARACRQWLVWWALSGMLALAGWLGWWSAESVYAEQVIYFYYSQASSSSHH